MRYLLVTLTKLGIALIALLGFYAIYLDSSLTQRFATERYEASAIVYARPLTLQPLAPLRPQQLIEELQQLRYRESAALHQSGTFQQQGSSIVIHRRPFDFADGPQMARKVRVGFNQGRIDQVVSLPEERLLSQFQLDPLVLGQVTGDNGEDRLLLGLERLPSLLIETLLLVEDRDFYHHAGVSLSSIGRAALANLAAMDTVQGGSTLTQQLVKNLYLSREQTLWRKANEALMALIIDFRFSKDEILETYFNEIYFGQDGGRAIHGVGLASRYYFGKQVEELTPAEIAMLVAIVKGPSYYNPHRYPERVQQRRDMILQLMFAQQLISQPAYLAALDERLVPPKPERQGRSWAPHYLAQVKKDLAELQLTGATEPQGLRVFTYFDPLAQQAVESSIAEQLPRFKQSDALQVAAVIADHQRASLVALVGDRNRQQVGFNRATGAMRQVGSLIKPVIYGLALAQPGSYHLGTIITDAPIELESVNGQRWQPENYDGEYVGSIMLYDALAQSRNIPAVRLGLEAGIENVVAKLRRAGVTSPIPAVPSLTLGSVELSPLQVSELYGVWAHYGRYRRYTTIAALTDHSGLRFYQHQPGAGVEVFDPLTAALVNYGLRGVVNEGTGKHLAQLFGRDALAGKSGTTNDYRDSWFVAYDHERLVTVWLGRDDNQPIGLTGASGALPVVANTFSQLGVVPLATTPPSPLQEQAFHPQTGVPIPMHCDEKRVFPAFPQQLPEDTNCEGMIEEKSWWQKLF
ncbi:penicillin-binding protein 1B [Pseudidiomarina insulisalsae]|uniref:Penicillin-binding protein 1B n=1 Tax=Pseudidiomarina insulisalsae TaxID=575789 RepID=A0A432YA53_9GAMM|nr:penicillin-binding protein 1B [Pseudidiomarina insulisalsae]RUO57813.1 penicillin-binding protein 1B [Pseudidiomarina insulisalsae]